MSKRKYRPVKRIYSLADFEKSRCKWYQVQYGNKFRMWHRSALLSLQANTLMNFIYHDYVFECEKIEEDASNDN